MAKFDHEKAGRMARVRERGAEPIGRDDRTLLPSGYPPSEDMARSHPKKRQQKFEGARFLFKQEPVEVARDAILRAEREKTKARELQEAKRRAIVKRAGGRNRGAIVSDELCPTSTDTDTVSPNSVCQQLPRSRKTRMVAVEFKLAPTQSAPRGLKRSSRRS